MFSSTEGFAQKYICKLSLLEDDLLFLAAFLGHCMDILVASLSLFLEMEDANLSCKSSTTVIYLPFNLFSESFQ